MATKNKRKRKNNRSKNHHYVGRGYLKPWQPNAKERVVWVADKNESWEIGKRTTRTICSELNYNNPSRFSNDFEIEPEVEKLESKYCQARNEVIKFCPSGGVMESDLAGNLLSFASLYACHSPDTRKQIARQVEKIVKPSLPIGRDPLPVANNQVALVSMDMHRNLLKHLTYSAKPFCVIVFPAPAGTEFITSDLPVLIVPAGGIGHPWTSCEVKNLEPEEIANEEDKIEYGFKCDVSYKFFIDRIYFPLSPEYFLIALKDLPPLPISDLRKRIEENLKQSNAGYASGASRWVISKNRELLEQLGEQINESQEQT